MENDKQFKPTINEAKVALVIDDKPTQVKNEKLGTGKHPMFSVLDNCKGYLLYLYDTQTLHMRLIPMDEIHESVRIKQNGETYALVKPCFYIDEKPFFMVLRGHVPSISFNFKDDKERKCIEELGYSPSEIDAVIHSVYTNNIFRKRIFDASTYLTWMLTLVLDAAITFIITYFSIKGV